MIKVAELYNYPIKSFRGYSVDRLDLDADGPRFDRQWLLVDEKRLFMTQRTFPQLAEIELDVVGEGRFRLSKHGHGAVEFGAGQVSGEAMPVMVWSDVVSAFEVNSEISNWLSEVLERSVRLVALDPEAHRPMTGLGKRSEEDQRLLSPRKIRFVDQQPLLVISKASLQDLEKRAGREFEMIRFRPNIVIEGAEAYDEDAWSSFKIGEMEFKALKPCTRCGITTLDPLTGERSLEPLKTLGTYRRGPKGIQFGYYYAHLSEGVLNVGDAVFGVR